MRVASVTPPVPASVATAETMSCICGLVRKPPVPVSVTLAFLPIAPLPARVALPPTMKREAKAPSVCAKTQQLGGRYPSGVPDFFDHEE
jgi:hypothetical protein